MIMTKIPYDSWDVSEHWNWTTNPNPTNKQISYLLLPWKSKIFNSNIKNADNNKKNAVLSAQSTTILIT